MLLTGCAGYDEPAPRPGVLEAMACVKKVNNSPPNYPDYIIRYCTNNGVWVVDQRDPVSGLILENYDFVNEEYTGPASMGQTIPFTQCPTEKQQEFTYLRKELNRDLLAPPKSPAEKKPDSGLLSMLGL